MKPDAAVCTLCGLGPDLATGALIRLPATFRWAHRKCLDVHVDRALAATRRVAHVKQRRLAREVQ